jgi:hypothetical protein
VKVLVLGHSDCDGEALPDKETTWPCVLERSLRAKEIDATVIHKRLFAGPTAPGFLERQLQRENPDCVVLALSTYGVAVKLISNAVRERFGDRAATAVQKLEAVVSKTAQHAGGPGTVVLTGSRRAARRVLGAKPRLDLATLIQSYEECIRLLAQAENIHTIVFGGCGYGDQLRPLNPGMVDVQMTFDSAMEAATLEARCEWLSHAQLLGGAQGRLRYFLPDGVHTGVESQRMVAEAMEPLILKRI